MCFSTTNNLTIVEVKIEYRRSSNKYTYVPHLNSNSKKVKVECVAYRHTFLVSWFRFNTLLSLSSVRSTLLEINQIIVGFVFKIIMA